MSAGSPPSCSCSPSVALLRHSDLTRLEGFIRSAHTAELVDPLIADVVVPLLAALDGLDRQRADVVIARWSQDPDRVGPPRRGPGR